MSIPRYPGSAVEPSANGTPLFESLVVFERATLDSGLRAQGGAWLNRHFHVIDQTNFPLTLFAYGEAELLFKSPMIGDA